MAASKPSPKISPPVWLRAGIQVTALPRAPSAAVYRALRLLYCHIRHKYSTRWRTTPLSTLHLLAHRGCWRSMQRRHASHLAARRLRDARGAQCGRHRTPTQEWNCWPKTWYLVSEWLATSATEVITMPHDSGLLPHALPQSEHVHPVRRRIRQGGRHLTLALWDWSPALLPVCRGRHGPENHPLAVRQAFEHVETPFSWPSSAMRLRRKATSRRSRHTHARIVIPGAIYGEGYRELESHCFAYIHATKSAARIPP